MVVTDFGIAKVLDTQDTRLTSTGIIVGTLRYASPEQIRGADDIDARTDIFSLGMVLYEMLVGRAYFEGLTGQAIIGRQLYEADDNRAELPPEVAPALRRIVARCIHKDRTLRYADAAELLAALDPAGAAPQPRTRREKSSGAKRTVLVAATAALIALLPWQGWSPRPPEPEPAPHPIPAPEPGSQPDPQPKPEPDPAPHPAPDPRSDLRSDLRSEPEPELVPLPEPKPQPLPDPRLTPAPKPAPEPLLVVDPAATALTLAACRWQTFQVAGADAANYRWLLDGVSRPERGARLRLRFPQAGSHVLSVFPANGESMTGHRWQIRVTPNPPEEQEASVWLEQYVGALRNKDYVRLQALGFSAQAVERLRRKLEPRQRHHAHLEEPRGTFRGDLLDLSFNRVDRWYDPQTYSMVVDYTTEQLQLHRVDCERIMVQSD